MSTGSPTPWWETLALRDEIATAAGAVADVQMSLHEAVHGHVGKKVPYADTRYYGEITHPTTGLVDLMAAVAVRLGSSSTVETARAVWRADQAMGGGKSHGLVGLWHLARDPSTFRQTDIGQAVWERAGSIAGKGAVSDDLGDPHVVVLSCDNMTPGKPDPDVDGPARTLGERFLWRLFSEDNALYKRYREAIVNNKSKLADAIDAVGRPVLILVDEVLDYLRSATAEGETELALNDMGFLRDLLEVVTKMDRCVLVLVMIASDTDQVAMSEFGERCRAELESLLIRNGKTTTVTSGADFAEIIRRRLFDGTPPTEVLDATVATFKNHMAGPWTEVFSKLPWAGAADFDREVRRSYPFHPALIRLAEKEWANFAGFQKVRSTLQIFAATAWGLQQRAKEGWAPLLIGPGDIPLSNHDAREAILGSGVIEAREAVASYREIAKNDVVADDDLRGNARQIDVNRESSLFTSTNPRVAERMATALFLYSLAPRGQGHRGATESELKAAAFVPHDASTVADIDAVLAALRDSTAGLASLDELAGKGGQERRLHLSTRQTLNMFYRAERAAVTDDDRDEAVAQTAEASKSSGPFQTVRFISAEGHNLEALKGEQLVAELVAILTAAGLDNAHDNRLFVLDPRGFTLLNGQDSETKEAIEAAYGLGTRKDRLAVAWGSSCVFAVVNTQRRAQARSVATEYLAWKRVGDIAAVASDEDLASKAKQEAKDALTKLEQKVKSAYQHVAYLAQEAQLDGSHARVVRYRRFDKDNHSSVDGSIVWAFLDSEDKVFAPGDFNAKALLNHLRANDWGLPLSEIRSAFYSAPRLPLVPSGDADLRNAIFDAYGNGDLVVVNAAGQATKATRPGDINVSSSGLRLEKPKAADTVEVPDLVGKTYEQAKSSCDALGLIAAGGGAGMVAAQDPAPGYDAAPGSSVTLTMSSGTGGSGGGAGGGGAATTTEVQVSIALMGLTLDDEEKRDKARLLFDALGEAADEDASHLVLNLKVVLPSAEAAELRARAADLGAHVTETEL